jgi:hypothetical protein
MLWKRAGTSMTCQVAAQPLRPRWLQASPIRRHSGRAATSQPGWSGTQAEFERRQRQARSYHQARRPVFAVSVLYRRAGGHPLCENPRGQVTALACQAARSPAHKSRRDCAGKQDRTHGLGYDGQGRTLQRTRRAGSISRASPRQKRSRWQRRDNMVGKG